MSGRTAAVPRRLVGLLAVALLTLAFLWPALVTGAPWSFPDTPSYYKGGRVAWGFVADKLGFLDPAPVAQGANEAGTGQPADAEAGRPSDEPPPNIGYGIRSVPYSMIVYPLVRVLGLWAPVVAMSAATAAMFWLVARDVPPAARLLLGLGLAATTALPFFGALFQPDILTVIVLLVPIAIMLHADRLGGWAVAGLLMAMAFATLAHYGNLPLAGLAVLWLGVWALLRGRRLVLALVALPLVAAVAVNLTIAVVVDSGPSLAPGRYPLLLARTIEDGPGYDYLTEVCPEAPYALCEVYETVPSNIFDFLWGPESVSEVATPEQLARVSAEELPMLLAILRHDPAGQIGAFLENSWKQFFLYGTAMGQPTRYVVTPQAIRVFPEEVAFTPPPPGAVQDIVLLLGVAAILWAVVRRRHPEALAVSAFLFVSLVVYAMVCGGLSAPVPRYQARLVWMVPLLGAVLAWGRAAETERASSGRERIGVFRHRVR